MCAIDGADDRYVIYQRSLRRARKVYGCAECGRVIQVGERYSSTRGMIDGHWDTWHTCIHCHAGERWLIEECGGFLHGGVLEDLEEHAHEGIGGFTLGRLIIGMRHHWLNRSGQLMPVPSYGQS